MEYRINSVEDLVFRTFGLGITWPVLVLMSKLPQKTSSSHVKKVHAIAQGSLILCIWEMAGAHYLCTALMGISFASLFDLSPNIPIIAK
jgi:hypothetical protein